MREVILIGAPWCGACRAMKAWFDGLTETGIVFRYVDIDSDDIAFEEISSVPAVIFRESGITLQRVSGAMSRNDMEHAIESLWTEDYLPEYYLLDERMSA